MVCVCVRVRVSVCVCVCLLMDWSPVQGVFLPLTCSLLIESISTVREKDSYDKNIQSD